MAKTSEILSAIMAKLDAQDARISALAAPARETVPARTMTRTNTTSATVKAPLTETVQGTIAHIASSFKGLTLQGTEHQDSNGRPIWYNAETALFSDLSDGQNVTLTMGMVTIPARVAKKGSRAGQTIAEHRAMRVIGVSTDTRARRQVNAAPITPAAQHVAGYDAVPATTGDAMCDYCGNGCPKFKYSAQDRQFHCSWRQFVKTDPQGTILDYAQWLSSHYVAVYHKDGFETIGGLETPPAVTTTPRKAGRPKGSVKRSLPKV